MLSPCLPSRVLVGVVASCSSKPRFALLHSLPPLAAPHSATPPSRLLAMGGTQSIVALQTQAQSLAFKQFEFNDETFWAQLWSTPTTPDQLWSSLNDLLLIQMRDTQPANFATLIYKVIQKLTEIVAASKREMAAVKATHTFVNTYTVSVVNNQPIAKSAEDPIAPATASILLNCVRILTRCLSLLVEDPFGPWFSGAGWLFGGPLPAIPGQTVDPRIAKGVFGTNTIGKTILLVLLDLLFTEGFTVHPSLATTIPNKQSLFHTGVALDKLWEVAFSATGAPVAGPPNIPNIHQWLNKSVGWSNYDANRIEVLRCLMCACSQAMFTPPQTIGSGSPPSSPNAAALALNDSNEFMKELVSETSECARWTPTLFWSLMNVALNYHPEGQAIVALPYHYTLFTDYREPLVEVALHFLLIVLDYRNGAGTPDMLSDPSYDDQRKSSVIVLNGPNRRSDAVDDSSSSSPLPSIAESPLPPAARHSNVFHAIFTELTNSWSLTSIYTNSCRLLLNALLVESTYLPQSLKKHQFFQELLVLTWKMADENPAFIPNILHPPPGSNEQLDVLNLITPLLYFVNESRRDSSQLGLMYTCVFLLLKLSGDREFSVALNRPVFSVPGLAHIPLFTLLEIPPIANATYADCLIVVCHKLIVSSPTHLDALLKVMLTLIANISPYLTKLSLFASVKLLNLFELFSTQTFLHENSTNHQYATMMLDIFNNVIQYQYGGNQNLVYSIIRRAKQFFELGRLELMPGMQESLTVEEQQRRIQAAQHRTDQPSAGQVASGTPVTIELADRTALSPVRPIASSTAAPTAVARAPWMPPQTFVPTPEWANSWKRVLPLEPIYRLLEFFEPRVAAILKGKSVIDEDRIISMIASTTLVGVLPVPHPIVVRKYIPNVYTNLWFSTFEYGIIFLRQQFLASIQNGIMANAPLWRGEGIKMFVVAVPNSNAREAERRRQAEEFAQAKDRTNTQIKQSTTTTPSPSSSSPNTSVASSTATPTPTSSSAPAAAASSSAASASPSHQLPLPLEPTAASDPAPAPAPAHDQVSVLTSTTTLATEVGAIEINPPNETTDQ